jgi:hypothetical protein
LLHRTDLGARRRSGANMQAFDLVDRGGFLPELDESRCFIHQATIGLLPGRGHDIQSLAPIARNVRLGRLKGSRSQQDGMDDLFQVAVRQCRVGIAAGDHFPLFGQTEATVDASGRL